MAGGVLPARPHSAKSKYPPTAKNHGGFLHVRNTHAKGLVPLDGKGWITGGGVPKPVAIQGRKALGVARRKPAHKSAVAKNPEFRQLAVARVGKSR
jgi:hypothetical protein